MLEKVTPDHLLGSTAHWTASVRAKESARADRLFDDPWAAALAGKEGEEWIEHRSADSVIPMVIRTRFFDDWLQCISQQDGIRQIALMAAGLDTRTFRLNWPEQTRQWVEMQAQSGAPWIGTLDDPEGFLAARGWKAALSQAGAKDANYGRWPYPVIPVTMPDMPHNWFVIARKE